MGPVTNSVLDATLSKAIVTDGVNFDARIWVFRLAEQHERFATVKIGFTPIPILLGDVLWVLQLGDHYGMEIIPALPVFRSKKNHAEIGQDSVRMDPKRFDIGTGQGNLSLPRNPGNFYLSDFIVENHLNNPLLANPIDSLPLQNIVVDKTRIAFDVVFLKNAPIRMIFDHQFDLVKLERNGKELEFDRKVWKGIHEKWRQSISDWRKLNRGEK